MCPVLRYYSANMRTSLHLQDIHKIKKGSTYYYNLLKERYVKKIEKASDVESDIDLHNNGSIDFNLEENEDQDGASQDIDSLLDKFVKHNVIKEIKWS